MLPLSYHILSVKVLILLIKLWVISALRLRNVPALLMTEYVDLISKTLLRHLKLRFLKWMSHMYPQKTTYCGQ